MSTSIDHPSEPPVNPATQVWFTSREAAAYVRMPWETFRRHAASDPNLRSAQPGPGCHRRFRREVLDDWIENRGKPVKAAS